MVGKGEEILDIVLGSSSSPETGKWKEMKRIPTFYNLASENP